MVQSVNSTPQILPTPQRTPQSQSSKSQTLTQSSRTDSVSFSASISVRQSQDIVVNRAYEQLRAVVDEARASLGIPEGQEVDTSPEGTANRIADFALNFFSKYAENNGLADDEAGRSKFADFIGGAILKGIDEARGILGALDALNPDVTSGIDKTAEYIQGRLADFVKNGL